MYTIIIILIGLLAVFNKLGEVVTLITKNYILWGRKHLKRLQKKPPAHVSNSKFADDAHKPHVLQQSAFSFYTLNMLPVRDSRLIALHLHSFPALAFPRCSHAWAASRVTQSIFLIVSLQLVSAAIYTYVEDWDFGIAFYHCMVTATTVGYGDVVLSDKGGTRIWASVHILLSVSLLGDTISIFDDVRTERAKDLKRIDALNRRLDQALLDKLNMRAAELRPDVQLDEDGINELEFVIGMSVELGLVDMDQIKPFIDQFRKIDVNGNGHVGMKDLRLKVNNMANLARLKRRHTSRRNMPAAPPAAAAEPTATKKPPQTVPGKMWDLATSGAQLRAAQIDRRPAVPNLSVTRPPTDAEVAAAVFAAQRAAALRGNTASNWKKGNKVTNPIKRLRTIQALGTGNPKIAPPLPTPRPYPVNQPVALTRLKATAKIASLSTPKGFGDLSSSSGRKASTAASGLNSGNVLNGSSPITPCKVDENAVSVMASGGGRTRSSCEADGGRTRSSCEPDDMDDEVDDETLTKVTPF